MEKKEKYYPQVGEELYLFQITNNSWIDMVKRPYTVIGVSEKEIMIQSCKLIFNGPQYYDTLPDKIEEDKDGKIEILTWHPKRGMWGTKGRDSDYPQYAKFGKWCFQPYLD